MSPFVQSVLLVLLGALATGVVGGIGFLIKRRFTKADPVDTFIERHERLLGLGRGSTPPAIDAAQRAQLRTYLGGLPQGVGDSLQSSRHLTQTEMNQIAINDAEAAATRMTSLVTRIRERLQGGDLAAFDESQELWERYQKLQAALAASPHEGGSIWPVIYHVERTTLIDSRISHLNRISADLDL